MFSPTFLPQQTSHSIFVKLNSNPFSFKKRDDKEEKNRGREICLVSSCLLVCRKNFLIVLCLVLFLLFCILSWRLFNLLLIMFALEWKVRAKIRDEEEFVFKNSHKGKVKRILWSFDAVSLSVLRWFSLKGRRMLLKDITTDFCRMLSRAFLAFHSVYFWRQKDRRVCTEFFNYKTKKKCSKDCERFFDLCFYFLLQ